MNLAVWLRSLGLERYAAVFHENDIDETVLPTLTAEDLKDLGVKTVGHRRKLLNAIALLRGDTAAKGSPAIVLDENAASANTAGAGGVTVMFVDLVGSTALSARMDPEDLRYVISSYQRCVGETVTRLGGFVANYMGDGVLVYFGYPTAHEDDAERAVRAGLDLVNDVAALKLPVSLQARVGIATGLVVVGDLIGSGGAQEHSIIGEAPNLAARLQVLAEPGVVVVAEATRKLVGDLFELRYVGLRSLKGIAAPVPAWTVLRPSTIESRFEALHASGLTALVRREDGLPNVAAALVTGKIVPGASGSPIWRSGDWEIEAHCGADWTAGGRTANAVALLLFAAAHRQPVLSDNRPHRTCCWLHPVKTGQQTNRAASSTRCWRGMQRRRRTPAFLAEMLSLPK